MISLIKMFDEREQNIHKKWTVTELIFDERFEKSILLKRIKDGDPFVKALGLLPTFLQLCFTCVSNLSSLSIITPKISFYGSSF